MKHTQSESESTTLIGVKLKKTGFYTKKTKQNKELGKLKNKDFVTHKVKRIRTNANRMTNEAPEMINEAHSLRVFENEKSLD